MTNCGFFRYSPLPGKIANLAPRAPRYSRGPRLRSCRAFSPLLEQPDVAQQARQQRLVDAVRVVRRARCLDRRCRRQWPSRSAVGAGAPVDAHLLGHLAQLRLEVLPLAHPQVVEELLLAHPPERAGAQVALLLLEVAPQVQPGQEVRALGLEPGVLLVRLRLELGRPLPRVLQGQRRRDDDHVAHAAEPLRLQDHPPQPRVDRQPRQPPPHLGQPRPLGPRRPRRPPGASRGPGPAEPGAPEGRGWVWPPRSDEGAERVVGRGAPGAPARSRPGARRRAANAPSSSSSCTPALHVALVGRLDEREAGDVPEPERRSSAGSPTPGWSAGSRGR